MFNHFSFFPKILPFKRMWKNIFTAGQATDDNTAHAYCTLET
jgi:hypothetical protein